MQLKFKPSADIQKLFLEAQRLSKVTDDPVSNPYKSKYEARELYKKIKDKLQSEEEAFDKESLKYRILESSIDYLLAGNYTSTEEISAGQEKFQSALKCFKEEELLLSEVIILSVSIHNELGLLWSNREEAITQAFENFKASERLYCEFTQSSEAVPMTVEDHFLDEESSGEESRKALEKLYTHTLYYLAQAYKKLDQSKESASCCLRTLRRQLEMGDYNPVDWALNCACLSQYFISIDLFYESRHCLACADLILKQVKDPNGETGTDYIEKRAEIARCWVKYYLALLEYSKNWVDEDDAEPQVHGFRHDSTSNGVNEGFPLPLEVESIEDGIPVQYITTSEQAKKTFLLAKQEADYAQNHFVLDGFVTDYVEINQDVSRLYLHTAHYEESDEVKCRMHKRRVDILHATVEELSQQYYLNFCQQLQFEIAETYSTMMDLKYAIAARNASKIGEHTRKKINTLCNLSMKHFNKFIDTVKVKDKLPEKYEINIERAALVAHFYVARLWSKILHRYPDERLANLQRSMTNYKYVVGYAETNPDCKESIRDELDVCVDMVDVLPRTLDRIVQEINAAGS